MAEGSKVYPVFYFESDTTGEKMYEEFYIEGEKFNMNRFISLGVIENVQKRSIKEIEELLKELNTLFINPNYSKNDVVEVMKNFVDNFEHIEIGKNLDQKM